MNLGGALFEDTIIPSIRPRGGPIVVDLDTVLSATYQRRPLPDDSIVFVIASPGDTTSILVYQPAWQPLVLDVDEAGNAFLRTLTPDENPAELKPISVLEALYLLQDNVADMSIDEAIEYLKRGVR